jgi:hypothetical protein
MPESRQLQKAKRSGFRVLGKVEDLYVLTKSNTTAGRDYLELRVFDESKTWRRVRGMDSPYSQNVVFARDRALGKEARGR